MAIAIKGLRSTGEILFANATTGLVTQQGQP